MKPIIVIGAGMGGLAAAVRLARQGLAVSVLEAREGAGGLASSFQTGGFHFDAGPYILLDRPGLEWAFRALDLDLAELDLRPIDDIYQVAVDGVTVSFHAGLERTAAGFERTWPGSGARYIEYVNSMKKIYQRLRPMLEQSRPGVAGLLRGGLWKEARFLLRPLGSVLSDTSLPQPVQEAIAIWTHVAGQHLKDAPSPMAFVSALIHQAGCFYPAKGIGSIPRVLMEAARKAGVEFRFGTKVRTIRTANGRVRGVETDGGEFLESGTVLSNHSGVGTYLDLVAAVPQKVRRHMRSLPLQSPGVCAYLAIQGSPRPPYLRFLLHGAGRVERLSGHRTLCAPKSLDTSAMLAGQETADTSVRATSLCRLLITPAAVDPTLCRDGWSPARLLGPLNFADAERLGESGQREYLEQLLAESWWRENVDGFRVLATRVPADWGCDFHLYRDSMNPVMTARFMRAGRLAHRSPHVRGLYLAGSSTHPGQWVSFCAISGILSADCVIGDLAKC